MYVRHTFLPNHRTSKKLLIMKTISYIILITVLSCNIFAQQVETVTVDISKLSPEARAEIESRKQIQKIQQYGEWVGLGKEIGIAVDSSLASVTDRAAAFADTDMGKVTMGVLVYKIVGKDLMKIIVGCCLIITYTIIMIFFTYRNCIRVFAYQEEIEMRGEKEVKVKTYRAPIHADVMIFYGLIYLFPVGILLAIMFI